MHDDYSNEMLKKGILEDQIQTGHMQYIWSQDGDKYVLQELNEFGFVVKQSLPLSKNTLLYVVPEQDDWPEETFQKILSFTDMDAQIIEMCQKL